MGDVWKMLSEERKVPEGVMTDGFIYKFNRYMDWDLLSENYDFGFDLLRTFQHRVNWVYVLRKKRFHEEFLREMSPNFTEAWSTVSKYQTLSASFMREFRNKLDWDDLILYQNMPPGFLSEMYPCYTPEDQRLILKKVDKRAETSCD